MKKHQNPWDMGEEGKKEEQEQERKGREEERKIREEE
jgi:hypothetical protein